MQGLRTRGATRDWVFVASLTVARVAFGYQFQSLATLGPELRAAFDLEYAALGTLVGLYMAPGILVSLPGGLLGARFGARLVVGAGLLLMAAGAMLAAVAGGIAGIGTGRVLSGAGAVALIVMQGQMIGDRISARAFVPVMSLLVGAFPLGVGLAGLTHGPLVALFGWPGMFAAGAAVAALAAGLFLWSCGPPLRCGPAWRLPSRRECSLVVLAGLIWSAYNAGYYGFISYMPSVLAVRGHPPSMAATVLLVATWSNMPATILGGWAATRFGHWPVMLVGTACGVVAVAGPAFADWPLVWATLFGTLAAVHAGVIVATGTLSARPENRAVAMGFFYTVYYLGGTVLPGVCGRVADLAGDPAAALVAGGLLSGLAIPFYALHQRLLRRPA